MRRKAYKFRIYPFPEQENLIQRTFGCCRLIWNLMLEDLQHSYRETKKFERRTPALFKDEFPFLKEVDSMALCNKQMDLDKALKQFLKDRKDSKKGASKKKRFPKRKLKKRSRRQSYTASCINRSIRIQDGKLRLPKLGLVRTVFHRMVEGKIKSATVSQVTSGKYYVSILTEQPDLPKPKIDPKNVVGIDMSFHDFMVLSNGAKPKPMDWIRKEQKRLAKLKRRLSRKVSGSQSYIKQRIKVARKEEHIAARREDLLHRWANKILARYDVVVLEDIDLKGFQQLNRPLPNLPN